MIESFIDGRIRLRSDLFADEEFSERLKKGLEEIKGVTSVSVNPRTCGVLIEYEKDAFPKMLMMKAAPLFGRVKKLEKLPREERLAELDSLITALQDLLKTREQPAEEKRGFFGSLFGK
ncbi:MAG TPA: hypothetical protein DIC53_11540 [Synergistaceae bacterium]|jgi:hypothetical protein|nr:hypothetical protein [Synergistaceae bacterium]